VYMSAGQYNSCAVRSSGAVACWGENMFGQIGDGTSGADARTARAVTGIADAISVEVGARHACALRLSGELWCWGYNWAGQLGDGTTTNQSLPVRAMLP
jgi:alpha-tubulin suppressor-like RCC1 family protein